MERILIIDDTEVVRDLLRDVLVSHGYEVDTALSADEGRARLAQRRPDLVLLDIDLPDVSGLELLKMWRRSEQYSTLPVIMITGRRDEQVKGFDAGADDFVAKPFGSEELLRRVQAVLRRSGGAPTAAAAAPAANPDWSRVERRRPFYQAAVQALLAPGSLPQGASYPSLTPAFLLCLCLLLGLAGQASFGDGLRPAAVMLGGLLAWAVSTGVLLGVCAAAGLALRPSQGAQLLSMACMPLLLKLAGAWVLSLATSLNPSLFTAGPALFFKQQPFWLARLDLFELWSAGLLWTLLRPKESDGTHAAALGTISVWLAAVLALAFSGPVLARWP